MLACVVCFLVCVGLAIHHNCLSHTWHLAIHHTCFSHTCHLAIHHIYLSHTWYLKHFRPAIGISTLNYNSALLSITDLCADIYIILCVPSKLHKLFRSVQKKGLAILVPLPHRYHNQPPVVPPTACIDKNFVRAW